MLASLGANSPQYVGPVRPYIALAPADLIAKSVSATRKDPTRVWLLPTGEVAYNGTTYRDFFGKILPVTGIPVFHSKTAEQKVNAHLVFLPGFGSSLSHSGSLMGVMRAFNQPQSGSGNKSAVGEFIANSSPDLAFAFDTYAFDLPGAGWAPALGRFPSAFDLSDYIRNVVDEIASDGVPTFVIGRSGSSALAGVAWARGMKTEGVIMTAATFPNAEVIDENRDDVHRAVAAGEYTANWDVINGILDRFSDPLFGAAVESLSEKILAISGGQDGQTSQKAQGLWKEVLGIYRPNRIAIQYGVDEPGGHLVVPKADHFVFAQPKAREVVSDSDSDVMAIKAVLRHIRLHNSRFGRPVHDLIFVPWP